MEDRMRKARLLQSVAILAGSLALTLAPADSRGQSAIDSGSQGYPTYGYGMPGSGAYDQQQFRTGSAQRPYGAADQYGVDRSFDGYGNQIWPQQAFDQPQRLTSPQSRGFGQGQQFGGPAYGPYGPQGSTGYGQQAYGQNLQQQYGQQDQQRYGQQAQGGGFYDSDIGRQPDPQSRFGFEQPGGAEDFYGQSAQDRWLQEEMQRRQQAYGESFGQRGQDYYSGQGYGTGAQAYPGQGYGMGGQAYMGQQFGQPRSMGDRQVGPGAGQYPGYPSGQAFGVPYGQTWQGQQAYGMQGQFQQDGRFAQDRGQLNRFGYEGGYPQFGRYEPGQQAYGQDDRRRMMGEGMMGQHMQQGGMGFDQQAYGASRPGGDLQQTGAGVGRIEVVSAGELVGRSVTDSSGQEIGTSRYLVIGAQSGKVHFVMVGSGADDALDLGTDLLPVPWRVVDAGQDQRIALSVPADRLRELPRVAPSELASVTGPQIVGRIRELITTTPEAGTSGTADQGTTSQSGQQSGTQQQGTTGTAQSGTQSQQQTATTAGTTQSGQGSTAGTQTQQAQTGTTGATQSGTAGQTGTDQSQQAQGQQSTQGGSRDQIASTDPGAGLGGQEDVVVLGGRYGALVAPPSLMTEGELAGTTVFSADGMPVGDIDEILIDSRRGQVAYVLVSSGGFLGTDQRWLPVPFTAMTWMPTRMGFALRIQSSQLTALPELAQGTAPRFIRGRDLANLYYAYGAEPYWIRPGAGTAGTVDDQG
jgi:sporulation protein YlmC with PRC-barrel domain